MRAKEVNTHYSGSWFSGLFNTKDHVAITLVILPIRGSTSCSSHIINNQAPYILLCPLIDGIKSIIIFFWGGGQFLGAVSGAVSGAPTH